MKDKCTKIVIDIITKKERQCKRDATMHGRCGGHQRTKEELDQVLKTVKKAMKNGRPKTSRLSILRDKFSNWNRKRKEDSARKHSKWEFDTMNDLHKYDDELRHGCDINDNI